MNSVSQEEQSQALTIDSLFPVGQIRLAEVSVCNWGSFSEIHTANIHPEGTLVTGENGAGKSTFIDGLMVLLQPPGRASFNVAAAQGDKSDRSLISYMRGYFGEEEDGPNTKTKSTRNGAVLTGIRALYRGDDGSEITLAGLFWITKATHSLSDVSRHYIVAKGNLQLEELTRRFSEGSARGLKHWLSEHKDILCSTDSFKDYRQVYTRTLYLENSNAPNLLGQALGLKKIDDLTAIIRDLVLEPSTVLQEARSVVSEFNDLVATHNQVQDARERRDYLNPLVELNESMGVTQKDVSKLAVQYDNLPRFLNQQAYTLCNKVLDSLNGKKTSLTGDIDATKQAEKDQSRLVEKKHANYLEAGGNQLESLKIELEHANSSLTRTSIASGKYQEKAVKLGLSGVLTRANYDGNIKAATTGIIDAANQTEKSATRFAEMALQLSNQEQKARDIKSEISDIKMRPNSNVSPVYQKCRDLLVDELGLEPEKCMFIAELLEVKDEEYEWQGAIERALGRQRITLLVPAHMRSQVTGWMNANHLGLDFFVQAVSGKTSGMAAFKEDGFLKKLNWRDHEYRDWLKHYLAGQDLHCVEDSRALADTAHSMTRAGLVNRGGDAYAKKDRRAINDRNDWSLGFSNQSRLALMQQELTLTEEEVDKTKAQLPSARKDMNEDSVKEGLWRDITQIEWDDINSPYWRGRVEVLKKQKEDIESNQEQLADAQDVWQKAVDELKAIQDRKEGLLKQLGELESSLKAKEKQLDTLSDGATGDIDHEISTDLRQVVLPLEESDLDNLPALMSDYLSTVQSKLVKFSEEHEKLERRACVIMSGFRAKDKWKTHAADWDADINSLNDYLEHYQQLVASGLPELEQRFQERLNKHTTQSLAKIKTQLEVEREDITERIEAISDVLQGTEFRRGTVLKLRTVPERYKHVDDFLKKVTVSLSMATSRDHEARYRQLSDVMSILGKASDPATCHSLESQRLLDPRYQMQFIAEEIDKETQVQKDLWKSSMGKSGGEKESFAGAIVAASLAYVLTPDGYDKPIYSTIFLDEAFSNTSESVSRRILNIFKDLNIHVNLITPYKNLNLARESARTLLMVERDADAHESHFSEMTWEEVDRNLAINKQEKLRVEAQEMGINIE